MARVPDAAQATMPAIAITARRNTSKVPLPITRPRRGDFGAKGIVLLTVKVSEEGLPIAITLRHSSGTKALDDAAIRTVRNWTFQPARLAGQPLAALVEIPIRFRLLT